MSGAGVAEQNLASRHGLLLGMTLAEVMLLVLFVMLLLLGVKAKEAKDFKEKYQLAEPLIDLTKSPDIPPEKTSDVEKALKDLVDMIVNQKVSNEDISDTWIRITDKINQPDAPDIAGKVLVDEKELAMLRGRAGATDNSGKVLVDKEELQTLRDRLSGAEKDKRRAAVTIGTLAGQNKGLIGQIKDLKAGSPPPCLYQMPGNFVDLRGKTVPLGTLHILNGDLILLSTNAGLSSGDVVDYVGKPVDSSTAVAAIKKWPLNQVMSTTEFSTRAQVFLDLGDDEGEGKLKCRYTMNYVIDDGTPHSMFVDVFLKYFYRQSRVLL